MGNLQNRGKGENPSWLPLEVPKRGSLKSTALPPYRLHDTMNDGVDCVLASLFLRVCHCMRWCRPVDFPLASQNMVPSKMTKPT